jgi:nucleotide-binding universal stress UspA family protein
MRHMESSTGYRTIIVALDGSKATEQHVLAPARDLAKLYGAALVLVRAQERDVLPAKDDPNSAPGVAIAAGPPVENIGLNPPGATTIPGDDFVAARAVEDQNAAGYLNILGNELQAAGFTVEQVDPDEDDPADAIVTEARSRDASLIVMGTHHRSGWERLFKGSNAERVLRHSPCPVLVVPLD